MTKIYVVMIRFRHGGNWFPLNAWKSLEAAEKGVMEAQRIDERNKVTHWVYRIYPTLLYS